MSARKLSLSLAVVGLLSLSLVLAPAQPHAARAATCGGEFRWPVKTLADRLAKRVNFTPRNQSVGYLRNLNKPSNLSFTTPRLRGAERKTYRLKVALLKAKIEEDHDIHLVVAPPRHLKRTMILEFPSVACVSHHAKHRFAMKTARRRLVNDCPTLNDSSFTKLAGTATITGVGFFDEIHNQSGVAPNGIELHPALSYTGTCKKAGAGGGGGGGGGGGADCTPGYSPCLPKGPSDYDCYGGSGDGPAYTKPGVVYQVTGSDPYNLDSDNDGKGCE